MKQLFLFTLLTIFAISCKESSDNLVYSPISEVDLWVKNNLEMIAKMNRTDVLKYEKVFQRAIFVAKSPEQRFALWNDKYTQMIKDGNLEENQRNSIKELQGLLDVDVFRPDPNGKDEFLLKVYNWADSAVAGGVFTTTEVNQLVLSLESKLNTSELADRESGGGGTTLDPKPRCECSQNDSKGFIEDDCGENEKCKKCNGCISTNFGCGPLFVLVCDGNCLREGTDCE